MARRKSSQQGPRHFTTFEVAKLLGVSPPAVVNWINQGLLPAHRTPGGHRRVTGGDLAVFARSRDLPLPPEAEEEAAVGERVLVVDDETDFCEMIREYLLEKGGFQVEIATSGFAAGLVVSRFRPHVILLDLMMPGMDGFDVLHRLRGAEETRRIPVIACSAYADPAVRRRVRSEGFDAFLEKPLRLDDLRRLIVRLGGTPVPSPPAP